MSVETWRQELRGCSVEAGVGEEKGDQGPPTTVPTLACPLSGRAVLRPRAHTPGPRVLAHPPQRDDEAEAKSSQ